MQLLLDFPHFVSDPAVESCKLCIPVLSILQGLKDAPELLLVAKQLNTQVLAFDLGIL